MMSNSVVPGQSKCHPLRVRLPGWLFFVLAIVLFSYLTLLQAVLLVKATYPTSGTADAYVALNPVWAILLALTLAWAVINLAWVGSAARKRSRFGIYGHWSVVVSCGLIGLGIQAVMFTREYTKDALVLDYSNSNQRDSQQQEPVKAAMLVGNAAEGRKAFLMTCITCHGPTGQGMPNLAPSLRGSAFISSADDMAVANVIRLGRLTTDPLNKSGKVMPARGGNPFLSEEQVAHLVAFVRSIQKEGESGGKSGDAPAVQLARWVVPAAKNPPEGMVRSEVEADYSDGLQVEQRNQQRRKSWMRGLTMGLTGVHGFFLLGVTMLSSCLFVPRLLRSAPLLDRSWKVLAVGGWLIAATSWVVVMLFCA